jgi:hypothetical protein
MMREMTEGVEGDDVNMAEEGTFSQRVEGVESMPEGVGHEMGGGTPTMGTRTTAGADENKTVIEGTRNNNVIDSNNNNFNMMEETNTKKDDFFSTNDDSVMKIKEGNGQNVQRDSNVDSNAIESMPMPLIVEDIDESTHHTNLPAYEQSGLTQSGLTQGGLNVKLKISQETPPPLESSSKKGSTKKDSKKKKDSKRKHSSTSTTKVEDSPTTPTSNTRVSRHMPVMPSSSPKPGNDRSPGSSLGITLFGKPRLLPSLGIKDQGQARFHSANTHNSNSNPNFRRNFRSLSKEKLQVQNRRGGSAFWGNKLNNKDYSNNNINFSGDKKQGGQQNLHSTAGIMDVR